MTAREVGSSSSGPRLNGLSEDKVVPAPADDLLVITTVGEEDPQGLKRERFSHLKLPSSLSVDQPSLATLRLSRTRQSSTLELSVAQACATKRSHSARTSVLGSVLMSHEGLAGALPAESAINEEPPPATSSSRTGQSLRSSKASSQRASVRTRQSRLDFVGYQKDKTVRENVEIWKKFSVPFCRTAMKNKFFQLAMLMALLAALFLPDVWIVLDRPTNDDLDVVLTCVLFMFITELAVQCIGLTTYLGSFFFWTDIVGAFSLLLDLSYLKLSLQSDGGSVSSNVVIMRMARVAKLGARAGRFTKLVKLLRFLPGMYTKGTGLGTAKIISNKLTTILSTRVSCLIIVIVMIMPLFDIWTYPEQDWSMVAWLEIMEDLIEHDDQRFESQFEQFKAFYADKGYYPYRLDPTSNATRAVLPWTSSGRGPPVRALNVALFKTNRLSCHFNFKQPTQMTSAMNLLLMVFIMTLMVCFSMVLSKSVTSIVKAPLERLLMQVRIMASKIFQSVTSLATVEDTSEYSSSEDSSEDAADVDPSQVFGSEAAMLEKVLNKLAVVSKRTNTNGLDAETMAGLGEGDLAVITGFTGGQDSGEHARRGSAGRKRSAMEVEINLEEDDEYAALVTAQTAMIESAGLSLDLLNSWNINPLELDRARNRAAVTYFLGPHNHGMEFDPVVMNQFLEAAEDGYIKAVPYHNWFHAVDVTHCVWRLMALCGADGFLNNTERYALLVSATCHDVGHPGLNNVFMIEASHELALRYNDKSPLENMHCARLFEFVSTPRCNIFAPLSRQQFSEVRKVCIEAILHTDNVHHFAQIKEVQMLYEVNSDAMNQAAKQYSQSKKEKEWLATKFPNKEVTDIFRQTEVRKILVRLLLHSADISNPSKPFRICRIWANKVLEEFFVQGDEELKAGIPVQALNDREKVNRPFSQIGFIEFLVSPLVFAVVRILPPLTPFADHMVENTRTWHKMWLKDTDPGPGEQEKQGLEERILKLEKKYEECCLP